jgi:hypothetical protein
MDTKKNPLLGTLQRELVYELGDHEVLISFVNDIDAEAFEIWWEREGAEAHDEWKNRDD